MCAPATAGAAEWGSPEVVHTGSAGNVHTGIDAAGDGVVAFESAFNQPDAPARVWVADVPAGEDPAEAVPLSADGPRAFLRGLAVAPSGQAAVVWEQGEYQHHDVMLSTRAPGGVWSPARRISRPRGHQSVGAVIIEPGGTVVVAWTRQTGYDESGFLTRHAPPHVEIARVNGENVDRERLAQRSRRPALAASAAFPRAVVVWERPGRFGPRTIGHRDVYMRVRGKVIRVRGHKRYLGRTANVPPAIGADAVVAAAAPLRRGFVIVRVDRRGAVTRRDVSAPHFLKTRDMAVAGSRAVFGYTSLDTSTSGAARPAVIDSGVHELDSVGDFIHLGTGGGRIVAVWRGAGESDGGSIVRAAVAEPGQPFGPPQTISAPGEWQDPNGYPHARVALNAAGAGVAAYVGRDPQYGDVPARVTVVRLPAS